MWCLPFNPLIGLVFRKPLAGYGDIDTAYWLCKLSGQVTKSRAQSNSHEVTAQQTVSPDPSLREVGSANKTDSQK